MACNSGFQSVDLSLRMELVYPGSMPGRSIAFRAGEGEKEARTGQRRNVTAGGKREIREKIPTTCGIVRHDSHVRKPGSDPSAGNRTRFAQVGSERSSLSARTAALQKGRKTDFMTVRCKQSSIEMRAEKYTRIVRKLGQRALKITDAETAAYTATSSHTRQRNGGLAKKMQERRLLG
ncbi:hypothetical protein PR048_007906 [Dryococelus australis]|uniref:Uncharacterized protein n=1 Tax=Dryococelus australis TaxID=614101 RepID=A0ABQ9HVL2_9NEOP|nr:hypothetical protein PR048_007906 [Dryococelus australis]